MFTQLGTGADILNLWRAMDRQSVRVRTLGRQGSDIDAVRDYTGPAGEGYTLRTTVVPPHVGGPAIREIRATLDRYVPGTPLQSGNVANWAGGLLALDCLRRMNGEITREAIIAEMDRTTGFSASGLTQAITYRPGQHLGPKVFFFQKHGTAWGPVHPE